jgi:putative peptidoglycan lipid II flippase
VDEGSTGDAGRTKGAGLGEARAGHMGAAAALLAGSVMLSRVVGYVREIALAAKVGVGSDTDAYYTAFMLPDLLNYLLAGGALAIAFIPLYNRVRSREGDDAAGQLFESVLGTIAAISVVATVALWLYADSLIAWGFPKFDPATRALTVRLTRIVLPAQIFFLTGGLLRAVLMAHGRFVAQALAPLIYNAAVIVGGLATGTVEGFAWGVLVGAGLGSWLLPLVELARHRRIRVRFAPFSADFRAYLVLALPLMLGLSLTTVDEWYDKIFGATLAAGTVAQLSFARKLMMAPVAVVGQAVGAAALPTLARFYAAGQQDELARTLLRTLQATASLAVLGAAACWAFADPLVEVIYRYGAFGEDAAERVAALLAVMAFAIPGWVTQQVAVRAFYAREEMWRPMLLGTGIALLAIPLYYLFARRFDAEGLAAAGAIAISLNAGVTLVWARLRHGAPALGPLFGTILRALAMALAAAAAGVLVASHGPGRVGALRDLALGGACFAAVVGFGVYAFGDAAMKEALGSIARKLGARLPGRGAAPK